MWQCSTWQNFRQWNSTCRWHRGIIWTNSKVMLLEKVCQLYYSNILCILVMSLTTGVWSVTISIFVATSSSPPALASYFIVTCAVLHLKHVNWVLAQAYGNNVVVRAVVFSESLIPNIRCYDCTLVTDYERVGWFMCEMTYSGTNMYM